MIILHTKFGGRIWSGGKKLTFFVGIFAQSLGLCLAVFLMFSVNLTAIRVTRV